MMSNTFKNKLLGRAARKAARLSDGFNFKRTDVLKFDDHSASIYERRAEIPKKMSKGDWWIVVALYAIVSAFAFVIM